MSQAPKQFDNVSVVSKANVYFDAKVVSHTVLFKDGTKKTLGLIYPGTYKFNTDAAERMEIVAGSCKAKLAGQSEWKPYGAGTSFDVPAKSHFEISVEQGVAEYVCSFF
ncbi:MAG: pyrimidine/purine nucleoside phosphorylase [Planctomycetota bacterium]|nr:pyrimidine/purine nucleoside phosphorylase [Planctomycetota bacterium]